MFADAFDFQCAYDVHAAVDAIEFGTDCEA